MPQVNIVKLSKINIIYKVIKFFIYLLFIKPDKIYFHESGYHFIWPIIKVLGFKYYIFLHDSIFWYENNQLVFTQIYKKYLNFFFNSSSHKNFIKKNIYKNFFIKFYMCIYYEIKAVFDYLGIKYSNKILTICEDSKREIDNIYKINSLIFYPGTNYSSNIIIKNNKKKIFFTVNRLTPRKRIELMIKSFYYYEKKFPNSLLIIAGTGPSLKNYKRLVAKLKLRKKIIFMGFLHEKQLIENYKNCDVVLYPQWGSWGLVALEALYFNKRVIVTSDSGTRDLRKFFKNSVIISEPNVNDFYKKMIISNNSICINSNFIVKKHFTIKKYYEEIDRI